MKMTTGVRLLRLLNTRPENALTNREIETKWNNLGGTAIGFRSIQRYTKSLSEDILEGPALLGVVQRGSE